MSRLLKLLTQQRSAPVFLLVLLLALSTSLSAAHVHSIDKSGPLHQLEKVEDCALCHASLAFTFNSDTPFQGSRVIDNPFEASQVSAVQLGYSYFPESRAPPIIS